MISRDAIQELIERDTGNAEVVSFYLDMSVNSDNKRTHRLFLNKERSRFQELDNHRSAHHQEAIGAAFDRLDDWLESHYDESKKGVAAFVEVGGEWGEVYELSLPLPNRFEISDRPIVAPLVEILERYHHHGVVLVDREHLRLMSLFLDQTLYEREVETEPYPTPHDVHRGGFSAKDYQDRKEEETRHFFKEFAEEVRAFVKQHEPDDLILLGTQENVQKFRDCLPDAVQALVAHTDRMDIEASASQIRDRLAPVFETRIQEEEARVVEILRDRVRQGHKAVAGMEDTLEQLQEGKLEALVIARGLEQSGGRCENCGFFLAHVDRECPYCGGSVRGGVNLGETTVRLAADQGVGIDFVPGDSVGGLGGVGGLLRF